MTDWTVLKNQAEAALQTTADLPALKQLRLHYLGRKGTVTVALKALGSLPTAQRSTQGKVLNQLKSHLERSFQLRQSQLMAIQQGTQLKQQIDVTLPARSTGKGGLHPLTLTRRRICRIFAAAGYTVEEGPEIETDQYNFELLNFSSNHPARNEHDTFYIDDALLLRTHTSPVQLRTMLQRPPPLRIICPGKVYRSDYDLTHTPMFHQIEGLLVDRHISFAHLKGTVVHFLRAFFMRDNLRVRFRPSFFPFTEPSAEVDIWFSGHEKKSRWLEVMGCGMVHPQVLRNGGIDDQQFSGFAFGLGVERMAMLYWGIEDLRLFFHNEWDFLSQFSSC